MNIFQEYIFISRKKWNPLYAKKKRYTTKQYIISNQFPNQSITIIDPNIGKNLEIKKIINFFHLRITDSQKLHI